jgi:putative acetyltransferase
MSASARQDDPTTPAAPHHVELRLVPWDDEEASRLRVEQQTELAAMYDGEGDIEAVLPADEMLATVLVLVDDAVAGCGALRDAATYGDGFGELKRMFVRPAFRGRGLSRLVLAELERLAGVHGLTTLILETGVRQTQAMSLYESTGYERIAAYGPYVGDPRSVCYSRRLPDAGGR